jgi:hypothetical protein
MGISVVQEGTMHSSVDVIGRGVGAVVQNKDTYQC